MVNYCVVPGCRGTGGFKFPSDPELQRKWRVAIKRLGPGKKLWAPGKHSVVCRAHFRPEDLKLPVDSYAELAGKKVVTQLKPGAIPSVFPQSLRCLNKRR